MWEFGVWVHRDRQRLGNYYVNYKCACDCGSLKQCSYCFVKPTSNNLETITDNESNFNNENNLLLIDIEPALAKGTQIKGKVTLIEV